MKKASQKAELEVAVNVSNAVKEVSQGTNGEKWIWRVEDLGLSMNISEK